MVSAWLWVASMVPAFFVLNEGAKLVTDNAAVIARRSGRSKFVVGVLLVATLGALPEILVAVFFMLGGGGNLAIGSVLGSNILNTSVLIGLPAVFIPIAINREILARDIVFLTVVTFVVAALLQDGELAQLEGVVLILLFIPYAANLLATERLAKGTDLAELATESEVELELMGHLFGKKMTIRAGFKWVFIGVALLVLGAEAVTRGAEGILTLFQLPPFEVGITVVAIGTSLPDMAAAIQAVRRGHPDLALAIGIGASIFTLLLTLGIMGLGFHAEQVFDRTDLRISTFVMMAQVSFVLLFSATGRFIRRWEGSVLFSFYPIYVTLELLFHRRG